MTERYFITTFGCQMNVHDSEVLAGLLTALGYSEASSLEEADFILLNTCCVRENAENRTFGHLGNLKSLKEAKPGLMIAICGCMMQEPSEVAKIRASYPQVDLVFGTHNLHQLPELIQRVKTTGSRVIEVLDSDGAIQEELPVKRNETFRAWVTIMYGCNNFCSYCIVPYVRGRERSRRPERIIAEIRDLVGQGVKEVTLLGQNVNSYGKDLSDPAWDFAALLRAIATQTGIARIRFQTSHPKDLSDALIQVMAEYKQIGRHLHLPVQAGSSRILQAMNRFYSKEDYLALIGRMKTAIPSIALTTDIIVGFPGETEADFLETLDVVERVRFDGAFTFIYSPRVGTPAASLADPSPAKEKQLRLKRLIELQNQISLEKNQGLIGTMHEVLVEGVSEKNPAAWSGRTSQNKLIHFPPIARLAPGDLVIVEITAAQTFTLEGNILS